MSKISVICTLWDKKAKFFASPFTSTNIDTAIRDFQNIVSNPKNSFYSHKEDYDLFEIASFNSDTGVIKPLPKPKFILNGENI
ncbi:hypothetical protein BSPLISOX_2498 [uncultured Gammaproteobacteria bacterium]|jgi:hypothetical protein|nr:hypothetical protein [uncultured Gammaproteobacteria bacterium]CAC9474222.1 hypothetical protein [uncultured Gammaproteobacteria bacterium]VVH66618.1 hypothetical protein BSPLISOX_2498 [uncultured Gammaproteobacteria bacterium]